MWKNYNTYYGNNKYLTNKYYRNLGRGCEDINGHIVSGYCCIDINGSKKGYGVDNDNRTLFNNYLYFDYNNPHISHHQISQHLINIDGDILYFNLHFCDKENFLDYFFNTRNMNELNKRSKFNFEKSKIICKILKEIK